MTTRVDIDIELPKEIRDFIADNEESVAEIIRDRAKASAEFADKTGNLRKSIKKYKSKFQEGGYIVMAKAPHAHLVEFGHGGKHPAPPHPFLRKAKEGAIAEARRMFGAR